MHTSDVYKITEELAPKRYSDIFCEKYGAYDNVGIFYDSGESVKKILFSLDLSTGAILEAERTGANLIITHHPAIYGKTDKVSPYMARCIKSGISVISMHLNLDCAIGGIDEMLARGICKASNKEETARLDVIDTCFKIEGEKIGYGKFYYVTPIPLSALVERIKVQFLSDNVACYYTQKYGKDRIISKVASFCGGGADEDAIDFAYRMGAELIVSSDFKHHIIKDATEKNISVISIPHYSAETYGFKEFYKKIRERIDVVCEFHTDENLL